MFDIPIEVHSGVDIYRQMWGWGTLFDELIIADRNLGLLAIMFQVDLLLSFAYVFCALAGVRLLAVLGSKMARMGREERGGAECGSPL